MRKLQDATGLSLTETEHDQELTAGQWRIDTNPAGGTTGLLEGLTDNKEQAQHIQSILANVVVETQTGIIPLQITGDALVAGTFRRC